ncbi:Gfo/Idh/MocA family oxidoreductase [Enterococcus faecium]|nr:Gfo/Idh/MocA family oxidoreductase [Enterococcus faecium]
MKVIFFGLGSIGKRHLKNLTDYGKRNDIDFEITSYRSGKSPEDDNDKNVTFIYSDTELADHYDIAFITNPTFKHLETISLIEPRVDYIFLEKPVFSSSENLTDLKVDYNKVYVAAPLRYKKVLQFAKELLTSLEVYSGRVICSTYLPNWRQGDYRTNYSAIKSMGGGVELDGIHELDYVVDFFGLPDKVNKVFGKYSNLEIDSNDLAIYLLQYSDKIIEIHLDYFGQPSTRKFQFFTSKGNLEVDLLENKVILNGESVAEFEEQPNQMYQNEIQYFMSIVVENKSNWNNLYHANKVLEIAEENR